MVKHMIDKIKQTLNLVRPKEQSEAEDKKRPWSLDPYQFEASHVRLAWLFRTSVTINIALAIVIVILTMCIASLFPLKEVRVALIRSTDKENKIYSIEPTKEDTNSFELVCEKLALRYPKLLLEIDPVSQSVRFNEAWIFTSYEYHKKFYEERVDSGAIAKTMKDGINRSIITETADLIAEEDGIRKYAVDMVQIDKRGGEEVSRKPLRAYLAISSKPYEVEEKNKFENPYGLKVEDMTIKEKEGVINNER